MHLMFQGRWLTCLWPGLAELWLAGSWSGLLQALGFSALLNAALATTLVWTDLLAAEMRFAAWTAVAMLWLMGIWSAWRSTLARHEPDGDLFSSALSEYLQGNWFAAEALLSKIVAADARDIEAPLLLAALFRRTGRMQEARAALDRLSRSQGAEKWELEIQRERVLLDRMPANEPAPVSEAARAADESPPISRAA
jgi:hypothetical protein